MVSGNLLPDIAVCIIYDSKSVQIGSRIRCSGRIYQIVKARKTEHGEQAELYAECGMDVKGIVKTVMELQAAKVIA
jgi:hypothetical protein